MNYQTTFNRGESRNTNRIVARAVALALTGTLACARGAMAQEAGAPGGDAKAAGGDTSDTLQQVVVTGSRISRTGFETPTPETVISQAELQAKAFTNVTDLVNDIPQLVPQVSYGGGITNTGYNSFNLRGLGATRTLVLVDGRRVADTSPLGGFDIDILPASLIKSIDVVTGGASAAYGSDAVSGVVNIQLDDKFEGFRVNTQAGETIYHDSKDLDLNALYGTSFNESKGHFVVAVDELTNDGATSQATRPWGDQGYAILANPAYVAGSNNGQPRNLILPDTTLSKMTDGGVIVSNGPLKNIQFGPGGVPEPFYAGANAGGTFATGGDGGNFAPYANLSQAVHRTSAFTKLSYDVSDKLTLFADVLYSRTTTYYDVIPNYDNGDITITQQNAFLPASVRATMIADNIPSVLMGRTNVEMGLNQANGLNEVGRYAFGAKGKITGTWTWDAVVQYTGNHYFDPTGLNRNNPNWFNAIDSVINPATGQPVCRSTLTHPTNGCVPVNLFGPNAISQQVIDYVTGTSYEDARQWQDYGGFNVQGEPFSDWAGPISVAAGVEARHEAIHGTSDALSQAAQWRQGNPQPVAGSFNVKEAYVETVVPLATDLPMAKLLELNGAFRETDYSTSGAVNTWKIGLNYKPVDDLRVRATVSRDIRAPDINELFATRNQQITQVTDRSTNVTSNAQILTGGNPDLQPEIGKTITGGFVYAPSWLNSFSVSIDYYNITIDGAISTLPAQTVIDDCYTGQTSLCANITRDPSTGLINSVFSSAFNAQQLKTQGFDLEAAYDWRFDSFFSHSPAQVRFRYIGTYVDDLTTVVDGVATNTAGQPTLQGTGGVPHWRMNLTSTYANGPFTFTVLERWVQGGVFNSTYQQGIDINNNHVVGRFYTDASIQYAATSRLDIYAKVDNLFNISPPIVPNALTEPYTASSPFYDVLGTTWAIGFRFNL